MLVTLCLTEITSWGVLYYAFPVLSGRISADTGWSATALMAAFSVGLVVSGLAGDRGRPVAGPAWASVVDVGRFAARRILGGRHRLGPQPDGVRAGVGGGRRGDECGALRAGFRRADSLVRRSTGESVDGADLGGRAGQHGVRPVDRGTGSRVGLASHLSGARRLARRGHGAGSSGRPATPVATVDHDPVHCVRPLAVVRSRPFLSLVLALVLASCAAHAVLINLVPFLAERGIGPGTAAVVLGVGGVGQVLGRLGYPRLFDRLGVRVRTVVVLGGVAVTTALLAVLTSLATVAVAAVLAGMVRGVFTLLQATAVSDRWGVEHYGALSGILAAPLTLTTAVAPFVGAALAARLGGYTPMLWTMVALALAATGLGLATVPRRRTPSGGLAAR